MEHDGDETFYLLDGFGAVVMGDKDSPIEFDTEEEAEHWADAT
jgi:mannose-6-phosphate isomerase-like protein (cupin superfamily)